MEWAESACYPAALRHKLLVRRCRCYLSLDNIKKAREVLEVCNNHVHLVPLEAKDKYETEVADLKQKIENHVPTNSTITPQEDLQQPSLYVGENKTVKYITNAFEMRENDKFGRHIVAVEEVSKGCEVFVEKPYAAILLPEHHKTHCHTCFSRLLTSFPEEVVEGKVAGFGEKGVYNGPDLIDKYRAVFHLLPHFNSCLLEDQLQYCLDHIIVARLEKNGKRH
ncbi:hypothetical protein E2C01_000933 [Portunus trituberculatus]|uniref:Uncharacterized protein n=1 Tax=Portunus trituberculatus TaxID=210409 RepID=A0A5B7CGE9_PORTR|nr:hypothetical protein [Portunus trituberculatus]